MVNVYSTNYASSVSKIDKFEIKVLEGAATECSEITIITAYYSDTFLLSLIKKWCEFDSLKRIKIIVSHQAKLNTKFGLKEIESVANHKCNDSKKIEIRINTKHAIMHAKLYRFKKSNKNASEYLLGSANASHAAFSTNEELMVRLPSSNKLKMYCNDLWENSMPLSEFKTNINRIVLNSVESFFQNGHLFVSYKRSLTLTYKPSKWIADLKIIEPQGDGFGKGDVGNFNIETYIYDKAKTKKNATETRGEQLKKYSLQTNLGLWVPNEYLSHLLKLLDGKKKKNDRSNLVLSNSLNELNKDEVFEEMMVTIEKSVPPGSLFPQDKVKEERVKFTGWLGEITKKLSASTNTKESNMTKTLYIEGSVYYLTPMSSIWSDPVEVKEFFETVFESITETNASSLVSKSIKNFLEGKNRKVSKNRFEEVIHAWKNSCWMHD